MNEKDIILESEGHKKCSVKTVKFVDIKHLILRLEFLVFNMDFGAGAQIKVQDYRKYFD